MLRCNISIGAVIAECKRPGSSRCRR